MTRIIATIHGSAIARSNELNGGGAVEEAALDDAAAAAGEAATVASVVRLRFDEDDCDADVAVAGVDAAAVIIRFDCARVQRVTSPLDGVASTSFIINAAAVESLDTSAVARVKEDATATNECGTIGALELFAPSFVCSVAAVNVADGVSTAVDDASVMAASIVPSLLEYRRCFLFACADEESSVTEAEPLVAVDSVVSCIAASSS